jgi:hypothetical protein
MHHSDKGFTNETANTHLLARLIPYERTIKGVGDIYNEIQQQARNQIEAIYNNVQHGFQIHTGL